MRVIAEWRAASEERALRAARLPHDARLARDERSASCVSIPVWEAEESLLFSGWDTFAFDGPFT
jgi:hypothetical protein